MTQLESKEMYRDGFVSGYKDGFFSRPATDHSNDRRPIKRGYAAGHEAGQRARTYLNTKGKTR